MAKNTGNGNPGTPMNKSEFTEEENLGFPPYWNPMKPGDEFVATVVGLDDGDPNFERWVFQASHDIPCHKGPKPSPDEDAESVMVKKGEFFSTSNYAQLGGLHQYIGFEVNLFIKDKVKIERGQMWVMGLRVKPETKKLLIERRQQKVSGQLPQASAAVPAS